LAISFENWRVPGESYYHTFGAAGRNQAFCHFHHYWVKAQQGGYSSSLWDYDLNYHCCEAGKFSKLQEKNPALELPYAYHFDSSLYGAFLRKYSENLGVTRTEGVVEQVTVNPENGDIKMLTLKNGKEVHGDFFVDCSGMRGLLIRQQLGVGFEDWSHWLPCDRAVAVPSERFEKTLPYTRSIAHSAGWQWRIPLQHRNGNGLVYSSHYYSDDEAINILTSNLDSAAVGEPKIIPFKTGRTEKQWNKNVVAVGLSSGFLEPLESTSIYLIQSAIVRLVHLFPHMGVTPELTDEYNRQSQLEYELIRDFIILHYHVNERDDSQFWRDLRNMEVPERLKRRIDLFCSNGGLFQEQLDIFLEPSWLQVMLGQGLVPQDYHPLANKLTDQQLGEGLEQMKKIRLELLLKMPEHDQFLEMFCKV